MNLNKSAFSSLCLAFFLSACSGGDGFGVGNGSGNANTTNDDIVTTDSETTVGNVVIRIGNGSGAEFVPGVIGTDSTDLIAFGSTPLFVTLVDSEGNLYLDGTTALFTSDCISRGLAEVTPEFPDFSTGAVNATYKANGCSGTDRLQVTTSFSQDSTQTSSDSALLLASVDLNISSLAIGTGSGDSFNEGVATTTTDGSTLSYGGDTAITVSIVDSSDNSLFESDVSVSFTSPCIALGQSTVDTPISTRNGIATTKYSAGTCVGEDVITVSVGSDVENTIGAGVEATATIDIAEQQLGALEFVSATPNTIALSGSGSEAHPEVSTLTFAVRDEVGEPMAGETVTYSLSTDVGGISLANTSSVTDSNGLTSVQLNAGGVNVSVSVIGSVTVTYEDGSTEERSTTSDPVSILGGLPDQDSFTIAADVLNPRGWSHVGTEVKFTIRAADRYNNLARDGTRISFVTDGGAIVGSCEMANGACSATWTSQEPRPVSGLVTILARTTGEESFIDKNSNGIFDVDDTVIEHLDEAFLDINADEIRGEDEFFSDFNFNNQHDLKDNTLFLGTNCSDAALAAGHCASLVEVRATHRISMSTDGVDVEYEQDFYDGSGTGSIDVNLLISDLNGNSPASGTTFEVSSSGSLVVVNDEIVLHNSPSALPHTFTVNNSTSTENETVNVKVTRVDGGVRNFSATICLTGVTTATIDGEVVNTGCTL